MGLKDLTLQLFETGNREVKIRLGTYIISSRSTGVMFTGPFIASLEVVYPVGFRIKRTGRLCGQAGST